MAEATTKKKNYFAELFAINVQDKAELKNGLTYLSWAYAWAELKKLHPDATYTVYENDLGWNYHTDGRTAWVKTGVTVEGVEHIEMLPVMDYKNRSIPADVLTSFDVNKAIQRSLTKAVARHGLGLYIYAGEDLPESAEEAEKLEAEKNEPIAKSAVKAFRLRLAQLGEDKAAKAEAYICQKVGCEKLEDMPKAALGLANQLATALEEKAKGGAEQ